MARFSVIRQLWADVGRPIAKAPHCPRPVEWSDNAVTASWLGHATVLLNFHGLWILADPVFSRRVGLGFGPITVGPKRFVSCALGPRELPTIDLIIISHAHMDHLDTRSLRKLNRDCEVIIPHDTSDLIRGLRFRKVHELGWKETREFSIRGKEITINAQQLRHWGARNPWARNRGYNAYILERAGRRLCLAGDTARTKAAHLGDRGPLDLMVVPISAYDPWIDNHCTPEEAVEMANEAGANYLLPVHHETFKLSAEPLDEPIRRFRAALAHQPHRIALTQIGETFVLPADPSSALRA